MIIEDATTFAAMSKKPTAASGSLKELERRRKEVIKPILENPFTSGVLWPAVDPATAEKIMQYLSQLLSRHGNYLQMRQMKHQQMKQVGQKSQDKNMVVPPAPEEASKITVGFNSTVKRLEAQAAPNREKVFGKGKRKRGNREFERDEKKGGDKKSRVGTSESRGERDERLTSLTLTLTSSLTLSSSLTLTSLTLSSLTLTSSLPSALLSPPPFVGYVFVARSDITTSLLTDCFPQLVFSSSLSSTKRVKLIELPRGASSRLSAVLHTENVSIISLCEDWVEARPLFQLIQDNIADVEIPWLGQLLDIQSLDYHALNLGYVRTSVPIGKAKGGQQGHGQKKDQKNGQKKDQKKIN